MQTVTLPPFPPSDNLYKFTAISGLIIFMLSLYVPWKWQSDLKIAILEVSLEAEKLRIEKQNFLADNESYLKEKQLVDDDFKVIKDKILNPKKGQGSELDRRIADLSSDLAHVDQLSQLLETRRKELALLITEVETTIEKVQVLNSQTRMITLIGSFSFGVGALMMYLGFSNWYFKFQIYQDRIVRAQAEQWTTPKPEREKEEIPG